MPFLIQHCLRVRGDRYPSLLPRNTLLYCKILYLLSAPRTLVEIVAGIPCMELWDMPVCLNEVRQVSFW